MRLTLTVLALTLIPLAVQADEIAPEACEITAGIVAEAQALRVDGDTERRATRKLNRAHAELGASYTEQVIPLLTNYVYMQPEAALDQDLAAFWKQTCLTTDLSSVLPGD
ncbi:hypothetical protein [Aestuariivita sp.]|uniref:hypothetical protein n=1 Tax=Aestuariivita sp. TaxID=1872407 RepID=UPI00217073AD|nr:hypothetical protein [Aestuariivita sp.]MCE8009369.1 hypothetical protein [Aestuariivita sp.]|eukprot:TRINITY_DN110575_c0_g1_i1.p2 TRINITY_DN110575_c0_g1~~TRINITY_DN110575_c0_g1_i1.p2  ORF type:complete len:110 (-),score=0.93 TRINITY_DN110575_c0_g1_i1:39-368(-)